MNKLFAPKNIIAGLIVGTLDICAAFIQYYIRTGKNPAPVLKFIASGVFGKKALSGGTNMIIWGLVFHYIIALSFTLFFFWLCMQIPSLLKARLLTGIVYGVFIWTVMQLIVLPLSGTPKFPLTASGAIIAVLILIACIGIPLSLMASVSSGQGKNKRI